MRRRFGGAIMMAAGLLAGQAAADSLNSIYGNFTFHMVKPPPPGSTRRILVQVNPAEQQQWIDDAPQTVEHRTSIGPAPPPTPGMQGEAGKLLHPKKARFSWFWKAVSPALDDAPGRLDKALTEVTSGPGGEQVPAPRLARMQGLVSKWGKNILAATAGHRVSPALVLAIMSVESGGKSDAVSPKGAKGLMQLIPATAGRFGVSDATDPDANIKGAVAYLDWLMGEFDNAPLMVLAAYNAGENAVRAANGVPPYPETRDYVPKVLAAWNVARNLCETPPELFSDGCVFSTMALKSAKNDG